jgi:DNA modification methylase
VTVLVRDPDLTIHVGDVRDVLATLDNGSVDCCVTSPPYWGLRDYGTGTWAGGDPDCDHKAPASGVVARNHGRRCVGIELNPVYAQMAASRLSQLSLLA